MWVNFNQRKCSPGKRCTLNQAYYTWLELLIHFPADSKQWSLVPPISLRRCMLSRACSFSTQTLFSFSSVCCALKKLPVNLAADNPTGEVLPANMYSTSQAMGRIISVMFKGCPFNRQASGGGEIALHHYFFFPPLVKDMGVCRLQRLDWTGSRKWCTDEQENAQSLSLFHRKTSKKRTSQISASLIHLGWVVPTLPVDGALVHWISNESSLTYIPSAELLQASPRAATLTACSLQAREMKGRGKEECVYFILQHKMMSDSSVKANLSEQRGAFLVCFLL